ncbi:hypothetical protein DAPPUDRAFT_53356 [Daphnia pulex]|uniref:ACB domain-containing protein n=1 Tax=Daphnia pulex TaxID=6669 RepID=E9GPQ0_DAPPU|nr:hypothetical protein DAPPUDRAFT_53356 [Daphnia pulex]|eukprot:EFX78551.1 hypothetical protein DAPPUDRAFT_53356 [Daphnia pulex]
MFLNLIISQKFNKAAEAIRNMTAAPSDDEMKEIYALYKQSTVGDVNTGEHCILTRLVFF